MSKQESNPQHGRLGDLGDSLVWSFSKTLRKAEENKPSFLATLDTLKTNSLLIYFNHFSLLDPGIVLRILGEQGLLDKTHVFVSQRHLEGRFQGSIMRAASRHKDFELLPVVQTKHKNAYENPEAFNRVSLVRAARLLREPGNIVLIAPEGERSKTGDLSKGEKGLERLFEIARDKTLAYPIAIEHTRIVPAVTVAKVVFGKSAFSYDQAAREAKSKGVPITAVLMEKIALLLPFENRGAYR